MDPVKKVYYIRKLPSRPSAQDTPFPTIADERLFVNTTTATELEWFVTLDETRGAYM